MLPTGSPLHAACVGVVAQAVAADEEVSVGGMRLIPCCQLQQQLLPFCYGGLGALLHSSECGTARGPSVGGVADSKPQLPLPELVAVVQTAGLVCEHVRPSASALISPRGRERR